MLSLKKTLFQKYFQLRHNKIISEDQIKQKIINLLDQIKEVQLSAAKYYPRIRYLNWTTSSLLTHTFK